MWIDQLAGIGVRLKAIPRCEICDTVIVTRSLGLHAHKLCRQHTDMARGAYQWVVCKIDRPLSVQEELDISNAVIQCLREEVRT